MNAGFSLWTRIWQALGETHILLIGVECIFGTCAASWLSAMYVFILVCSLFTEQVQVAPPIQLFVDCAFLRSARTPIPLFLCSSPESPGVSSLNQMKFLLN